jgi:hypothetical protein
MDETEARMHYAAEDLLDAVAVLDDQLNKAVAVWHQGDKHKALAGALAAVGEFIARGLPADATEDSVQKMKLFQDAAMAHWNASLGRHPALFEPTRWGNRPTYSVEQICLRAWAALASTALTEAGETTADAKVARATNWMSGNDETRAVFGGPLTRRTVADMRRRVEQGRDDDVIVQFVRNIVFPAAVNELPPKERAAWLLRQVASPQGLAFAALRLTPSS